MNTSPYLIAVLATTDVSDYTCTVISINSIFTHTFSYIASLGRIWLFCSIEYSAMDTLQYDKTFNDHNINLLVEGGNSPWLPTIAHHQPAYDLYLNNLK